MNKLNLKKLFIISLTLLSFNMFAQSRQIIIGKDNVHKNSVLLVAEKQNSVTLKFDLNELNLIETETDYGLAYKMESDKAPIMLEEGKPELFYLTASIIIPDTGSTDLEISFGEYTDIEDVEIVPSKGNLKRNINPETVPYQKGEIYNQNEFFPGIPAKLDEPFIVRDFRGQRIEVYPVQYNPVTNVLRVYSEIIVTAVFNDIPGINEFINQKRNKTFDTQFVDIYNNLFINHSAKMGRDYPTEEDGELLIICYPDFVNSMKPYIDWKQTIGRKTTLVTTEETGTTSTAIKSYISRYYSDPENNLSYVLLVGDAPQIPPHGTGTVPSDVIYGQLVGNDAYLEVLIGRMSAENNAQVQTQVQRSIWYERDITTNDTWLESAVGIAANEGPGHDGGEYDYVHMNNIRNRLLDYGYNTVYQEYSNNCPGIPNTSIAQISSRFNSGAGIANYINHGSETCWTLRNGPSYCVSNVNQLQNAGKLPFIFSVACLNGRLTHNQPCFAEGWLRATQNNQPTGAVATLMATISIGWMPPMTAQDEFINMCIDLPSPYGLQPGVKRTFAGAALNASMGMLKRHGTGGDNLNDFNSWTVFGDPTLMIRTKAPLEMEIYHLPVIFIGASEFELECDTDGALVTLSYTDENNDVQILSSAKVVDGIANLIFDRPVNSIIPAQVAVVATNRVTYIQDLMVKPANEPFVVLNSFSIDKPDFGETIGVTLSFKNASDAPYTAYNVNITVETESNFVTIGNNYFEIGDITPETLVTLNELFVTISEFVPDNEKIILNVTMTCEYEDEIFTFRKNIQFTANAPVIELVDIILTDFEDNLINYVNPGESALLKMRLKNSGHAASGMVKVLNIASPEFLNFDENVIEIESVELEGFTNVIFTVFADEETVSGMPVEVIGRIFDRNTIVNFKKTVIIGEYESYNMANNEVITAYCNFYDSGGPNSNYSNNQNLTMTFYPLTEGKKLNVKFLSFDVENYTGSSNPYDYLDIFDGINTSSTRIGRYFGTNLPPDFTATNEEGAITFFFKSDNTTNRSGWEAIVYESVSSYTVSFEINDEFENEINDATIVFSDINFSSNYSIPYIFEGEYSYTVSKKGYYPQTGSVIVEQDEHISLKLELNPSECFKLTFAVISNDIPVENATLTINNRIFTTNNNGDALIEMLPGKYEYSVAKDGYQTEKGFVTLGNEDKRQIIILNKLFSLTFNISLCGEPVEGAVITINNLTQSSDENGQAQFIMINGTYEYTVTVSGHSSYIKTTVIENDDLDVFVNVVTPSSITFIITHYGEPAQDAIIEIDGQILTTDDEGMATAFGLMSGIYEYTVTKDEYATLNRKITKTDCKDEELPVSMYYVSIENREISNIYAYPNPFTDIIYIGGNSSLIKNVYINNMLGQRIKEIDLEGKTSFSTENLPKGIYLVVFERFDKKMESVRMIKK